MSEDTQTHTVSPPDASTGGAVACPSDRPHYFHALELDDNPHLLEESYKLRYQVYCVERAFLPLVNYPDQLEFDEFDRHSLHIGVLDIRGALAGTSRVVSVSIVGLPAFRRCTIFPEETEVYNPRNTFVEISRLSVSRNYRRRRRDGDYGLDGSTGSFGQTAGRSASEALGGGEIVINCLKASYQASRRLGASHWIVAIERSLKRLLAQYGFSFRAIGPESEYFGLVAPYIMDLSVFEETIRSRRFPVLDDYLVELEPQFASNPDVR